MPLGDLNERGAAAQRGKRGEGEKERMGEANKEGVGIGMNGAGIKGTRTGVILGVTSRGCRR